MLFRSRGPRAPAVHGAPAVSSRLAVEPAMPLLTVKWRPRVTPRTPPAPAPTQDPSLPRSNAFTHTPDPLAHLHAFTATAAGTFHTPHRARLVPAHSPRDTHRLHISGRATFSFQSQHRDFTLLLSRLHSLLTVRIFCLGRSPPFFLGFFFGRSLPSSLTAHSSPRSTIASRRFTARCNLVSPSLLDSFLSVVQGK